MTKEELDIELFELDKKYNSDKKILAKKYALSNNPYNIGDVFTDYIGSILIEKIHISYSFGEKYPECVYYGLELKKNGTPKKSNKKRNAWQSNDVKQNN